MCLHLSVHSYGDHYWMWDVLMDCSKLPNGFFEVKGYIDGWEPNVNQKSCTGNTGTGTTGGTNHIAR